MTYRKWKTRILILVLYGVIFVGMCYFFSITLSLSYAFISDPNACYRYGCEDSGAILVILASAISFVITPFIVYWAVKNEYF